jgi:hypothetical protein
MDASETTVIVTAHAEADRLPVAVAVDASRR